MLIALIPVFAGIFILQYRPQSKFACGKRRKENRRIFHRIRKNQSRLHSFRVLDIGMLLTEVSTRLRSGAMLESAWNQTLIRYKLIHQISDSDAENKDFSALNNRKTPHIPQQMRTRQVRVLDDDGVPLALRKIWQANRITRMRMRIPEHLVQALPAAFAVCRLGYCAGAPMAEVLDSCARGVTEANEARAARKTALAGPIASARMLAALPIIGIIFGMALGANAVDFCCILLPEISAFGSG
ncbi:hypothetical protein RQN30_06805 [Arcanobacterium hippocoleae]